jgi:chromosome segregation ATPase
MCINKEDYKQLAEAVASVKEQLKEVKHDTGNIKTSQQGITIALKDVNKHLAGLNSRTSKVEHRVENLEDPVRQGAYCVQKDTIEEMKNSMLTIEKYEEWERRKGKKREEEERKKVQKEMIAVQRIENKQRQMQWVIGAIVGAGTFVIGLLTIFL